MPKKASVPSKLASPQAEMTADEYRAAVERHGFSQGGLAVGLGYATRRGQAWALGEARVPGAVVVVLRLLDERPELIDVLKRIAPFDKAARSTRGRKARKAPGAV